MSTIGMFFVNLLGGYFFRPDGWLPGQALIDGMAVEVAYLLRVLCAGAFGILIGVERSRRQKEAGVATHFIVSAASALFTCVSIYVSDVTGSDGGRIAAQVVTGISFLGAGVIFFRRESLRGLTTAAGIWATAAIGMATAMGLYFVAGFTTVALLIFQIVLHTRLLRRNRQHLLFVKMVYTDEIKSKLLEYFGFHNFHRFKVTAINDNYLRNAMAERISNIADPVDSSDGDEGDNSNNSILEEVATDDKARSSGKILIAETVIYPTLNVSADEISKFIRENTEILSIERLEDL